MMLTVVGGYYNCYYVKWLIADKLCSTYGVFQICLHRDTKVDPDHRDAEPMAQSIPRVSQFIEKHFKGINPVLLSRVFTL